VQSELNIMMLWEPASVYNPLQIRPYPLNGRHPKLRLEGHVKSGDAFTFNANQWYAIKIVTDDGSASGTKWYVDGTLVGNNGVYLLGVGTYFSYTCQYGKSNIDNIKITY
jgi:hypothetical protein